MRPRRHRHSRSPSSTSQPRTGQGLLFSAIHDSAVGGAGGLKLGRCVDLVARFAGADELIIIGLVLLDEEHRSRVLTISDAGDLELPLTSPWAMPRDLAPLELGEGEVLVGDAVVGRCAIDVELPALVHVADVVLVASDQGRVTVGAAIPAADRRLTRLLQLTFRARTPPPPIRWGALALLPEQPDSPASRTAGRKLALLHPAQLADLIEAASHSEGEQIIRMISHDGRLEAEVFEELDDEHQSEFLASRSDAEAAWVLAQMDADDAAHALLELASERRRLVLEMLPTRQQEKIGTLLQYHQASAGGMMNPDFLALDTQRTVQQARAAIQTAHAPAESLHSIFVTDHSGALVGRVDLVTLMRSQPEATLATVMERGPARVPTHATLPEIAVEMSDFNLTLIPVVDDNGHPVGAITIDDIIELMLPTRWRILSGALASSGAGAITGPAGPMNDSASAC